jgi:hypothetical protein
VSQARDKGQQQQHHNNTLFNTKETFFPCKENSPPRERATATVTDLLNPVGSLFLVVVEGFLGGATCRHSSRPSVHRGGVTEFKAQYTELANGMVDLWGGRHERAFKLAETCLLVQDWVAKLGEPVQSRLYRCFFVPIRLIRLSATTRAGSRKCKPLGQTRHDGPLLSLAS